MVDRVAQAPEMHCHPWPAVERGFRILLIDQLHELEVRIGFSRRCVVEHGAIDPEQLALPPNADRWMSGLDKLVFVRELFFSATPVPS